MTENDFPEISGLMHYFSVSGVMRYQLRGGEWVAVYSGHATLYRVPARQIDQGVGGVVESLTHDGTRSGIEAAVRLLLRYAY